MSCFLTLTRILDFKAPGLPGYHKTELATEGSAVNPMYFDLGETVDTVPCGVRIAKSTETWLQESHSSSTDQKEKHWIHC